MRSCRIRGGKEETTMNETSARHLATVFITEAVAAARNEILAQKADHEGRVREARLFRSLALAQQVHSGKALMLLRGKASLTEDNLADTIQTMEHSIERYRSILEEVEGAAKNLTDQFLRTAKNHLGLLKRCTGQKEETVYHVCRICGFIAVDKVPDRCPVCQAIREKFKTVD